MRPEPLILNFGERSFTLRPLTLGQLRQIENMLSETESEGKSPSVHETAMRIFEIVLRRDYPNEATPEFIESLEGPEGGVVEMSRRILRFGGFDVGGETATGEAQAAAPAAGNSGAGFTRDFSPAADHGN